MPDYIGTPATVGNLRDAAELVEEAWRLTADAFAEQQVQEYAAALRGSRSPRGRLHPWVPGLYWHRAHLGTGHRGPVPPEVLVIVRDMHGMKSLRGLLPAHGSDVTRRMLREGERALSELRVAAQYHQRILLMVASDIGTAFIAVLLLHDHDSALGVVDVQAHPLDYGGGGVGCRNTDCWRRRLRTPSEDLRQRTALDPAEIAR